MSSILEDDAAFLLFHDDADGCCAAAVLLNLIAQKGSRPFLGFASPEKHSVQLTHRLFRLVSKAKPRFLVSVDLALTRSIETIDTLLEDLDARMLIYDHHIQSKALPWPERCLHINPFRYNLKNQPASWFAYVLHRYYTKTGSAAWAAAIGIAADYRADTCREPFEEVRRKYPALYPFKTINQKDALRSPLMIMAHLVNAGYQHSDYSGARLAVQALQEALLANDPFLLLEGKSRKAKVLQRYKEEVTTELTYYLERFASEAEFRLRSKVAFFWIDPRFNIASQLATELQHRYPETVTAVISPETRDMIKISLRRGDKLETDLAALAQSTIMSLTQAAGGGHRDAAGCTLRRQDLDRWQRNVLQHLQQHG
jgi:outer membrane lipopolysaccharide assembly protein LptE/RlpB